MSHLSQEQKAVLQQRLQSRERFLHGDVKRELDKTESYSTLAGEAPDAGDQATATLLVDTLQAEVGRDVVELREIADALARLPGEDYGICVDCGREIPYERLQVQPTAVRCVSCQGRYEQSHAVGARRVTL